MPPFCLPMLSYKAAAEGSAPPGKRMTRAEAARHASLVRWKKENPLSASVAERLAQIRAARLKKKAGKGSKGGKGKGAKPKAPKQTADQRKQAKLAEQATNRANTLHDVGLPEDAAGALDDLASGRGTDDDGGLIKLGLAEEADDGSIRLTAAGRAVHRAAGQGDTSKVKEAISRGTERRAKHVAAQQKKAQRDQAKVDKAKVGREKKRKADGKEKPAKEKAAPKPDKAAQTAENRKNVLSKMAAEDAGITSYGRDALAKLADGGGMDEGIVRAQERMGLVERDSDGKPRATAQGRALLRAIDKGDYGMALDAVSRAKDKVAARQAKDKAKQGKARAQLPGQSNAERGTGPRKPEPSKPQQAKGKQRAVPPPIGRRPQPMERKMAAIDEIVIDLKTLRDELVEDDAIKAGRRNAASDQAQIDQGYELAMQLCDLFESLGADTGEEEGEAEGDLEEGLAEEEGEMEGKAERFGGKPRDDLEDSDFAGPGRTYPIMTAADVKDAASLIGKAENPDAVKRKIIAIAKRKGFEDALPEAWKEETKKSADDAFVLGDAVKALADGGIGAYAVRFGSEDEPDMSTMRDYFTKATDYWLDAWDRRPMLYHHTMDEDTQDAPRIGTWTKAEIKDEGVWLEGQLDRHHRYYGAIKELVRRGVLRLSSDSAPHLVRRAAKANGIHEVTRWPMMAASLTPTPAEPRLQAASFKALLAEYGIDDTDNQEAPDTDSGERPDEVKAAEEKARRLLLLELELLDLEAAIT